MKNALLLVLLLALSGCETDPLGDGDSDGDLGNQSWTFTLYDHNGIPYTTATSVLRAGGASAGFVQGWKVVDEAEFGCSLYVQFQTSFEGSTVNLRTISKDVSLSTCSDLGVSPSSGSGTANGTYGSATSVLDGTVELRFTSSGGDSGGFFPWTAVRE
jgi:hypothetical protein